ncbi:MAG: DNA polymerase III subunit chi [Leptothrix sp. (in: b-proteobacteria)]
MALAAVAFHFNVPQRQAYCCRLLRKALRAGARIAVTGDAATLGELDRQLWLFDALEFLPHWRGASIDRLPARLAATPIVLLDDARPRAAASGGESVNPASALAQPVSHAGFGHPVLLNLGDEVPACAADYDRVIEVVGRGELERQAARLRWRQYSQLGVPIERHEVAS